MGRKHTCRVRIANTTVTKIWCQKQMVSVFWVAESVQHPGPATVGWIPFSCPCPIVTGRWMRLFLIDGLYPAVKAWQMHHPVIIELFGVMCQDSPKDGSHLFSQINSKHHGQAFRHLGKGRRFFVGSARVSKDRPAKPRSRWSTRVCKEKESLARGHRSGTSSSLWSLQYSDPRKSSWSWKSWPTATYETCTGLILFSVRGQRRGRVILLRITRTFAPSESFGYHDIPGERQVLYAAPLLW